MAPFTYAALYSITLGKLDNLPDSSTTDWEASSIRDYKYRSKFLHCLSSDLWQLSLIYQGALSSWSQTLSQYVCNPMFQIASEWSWPVWKNLLATPRHDACWQYVFLVLLYFNKRVTFAQQTLGPEDGISHNSKGEKLMDIKTEELPSWILLQDLTPKGTVGLFQRGYYQYHKYVNVKKGNIIGVSMLLASYMLFNYSLSFKELKHKQLHMYHWRGPSVEGAVCIPDHDLLCQASLIFAEYFPILTEN